MDLLRYAKMWPVLLAAWLCAACASPGGGQNAGELLQSSIAALSGKENFAFDGVAEVSSQGVPLRMPTAFEGLLAGRNQLYIRQLAAGKAEGSTAAAAESDTKGVLYSRTNDRWIEAQSGAGLESALLKAWNPVSKLEQLADMKKTVSKDTSEQAPAGETVLRIEVDPADMQKAVIADLRAQQSKVSEDAQAKAAALQKRLNEADQARLKQELQQAEGESLTRFEQMAGTLRATGTYMLWVSRSTKLPSKLTIETGLNYELEGAGKAETVRATYQFKDYDKPLAIPQQ
ncbi:hypothetical protein [Paenibacillus hamazuiensis]|uniref:hypothetical protein n=1 Tax=Paenibacillus hamazuiensis TaxID=2936508 RepID=UPI00200C8C31|nr:hypothetical protein [Paenibacillus hamazuiensis]